MTKVNRYCKKKKFMINLHSALKILLQRLIKSKFKKALF